MGIVVLTIENDPEVRRQHACVGHIIDVHRYASGFEQRRFLQKKHPVSRCQQKLHSTAFLTTTAPWLVEQRIDLSRELDVAPGQSTGLVGGQFDLHAVVDIAPLRVVIGALRCSEEEQERTSLLLTIESRVAVSRVEPSGLIQPPA